MPTINEDDLPVKLDSYDRAILDELEINSRISFQQLGKKVRLARDTVAYRVKKLEAQGVIDKYTIKTNYEFLGYQEYIVLFQLYETESNELQDFYNYLINLEKAVEITAYTDKWDLRVVFHTHNVHELDKLLSDINNNYYHVISDQEIMAKAGAFRFRKDAVNYDFDDKDKKIINILFKNSRESLTNIAKQVNMSSDAIMNRLKKYKGTLVFTTDVNYNKAGLHYYTLLLRMKKFTKKEGAKLNELIVENKSFLKAIKVIGNWNIILTVLAKDAREFHLLIQRLRSLFSQNIRDFDTLIAYKELKNQKGFH